MERVERTERVLKLWTIGPVTYLEKSHQTTHSQYSKDFGHLKNRWRETPCSLIGRLVNNDVDNGQQNYKQVDQVPFVLKVVASECQSLLKTQKQMLNSPNLEHSEISQRVWASESANCIADFNETET